MLKANQNVRNAIYLGTLCSVSYLAVYVARNVLSAVTPQMVESGVSTEAYIGSMSSLYFICYAIGQLINGILGDRIKAKYMLSFGLLLAGVTTAMFPLLIEYPTGTMAVYASTGFFLSMIYGPMAKLVSENTEPIYTTRCSLGYTFASFFGSPVAGMLAVILSWQGVFAVSSLLLVAMAAVCFFFFWIFEKKGIVKYGQYKTEQKGVGNIKVLFRHHIVKYSFISILTGIVRTSVVFWLPTYISQYLNFSYKESAGIFTAATLAISMTSFIVVFLYEKLFKHNMERTVLAVFISSVCFFTLTYFVKLPVLNIVFIVLAIMSSNGASTMLWSRYCPSLRDTGMVSSATGFLDALSYLAAAVANILFANAISTIGWGNLILVWLGLVSLGVIVSLPYGKFGRKEQKAEA